MISHPKPETLAKNWDSLRRSSGLGTTLLVFACAGGSPIFCSGSTIYFGPLPVLFPGPPKNKSIARPKTGDTLRLHAGDYSWSLSRTTRNPTTLC
ncbi:MAG: hypothetical protein BWX80_04178 [Candidatus Hydrogenedentes bacterium ADurb.Bin101]|nr:MAG: hypothetical protein BWX80_04178 [Candidatus Hydrogenedentes bacterium ADurb.Bin101]